MPQKLKPIEEVIANASRSTRGKSSADERERIEPKARRCRPRVRNARAIDAQLTVTPLPLWQPLKSGRCVDALQNPHRHAPLRADVYGTPG
ncbi:hypothetical protein [Terricaulis sp.]|uniref:hypothetical protein n=1 Tax=Terricaulis sp. TaxID=2768686 RepID=UPI002AC5CDF8|nr:hypothetical protein [Terricaulis sp.]MDZ4690278.1 hypothetical protein [Terricaulis sp.]